MRGRGLLVAAAVLQLVGAALGLVAAVSTWTMASATVAGGAATRPMHGIAAFDLGIAAIMIPASIALLMRKRWGWWVSIVVVGLFGMALLAMPAMGALSHGAVGVGVGEAIILAILGAPIFVTLGLLVGGRHAVLATAAPPTPAATLRGE
jgi:hypothetical protein